MPTLRKLYKPSISQELKLRSENRDQYIAFLKRTGEYEERINKTRLLKNQVL